MLAPYILPTLPKTRSLGHVLTVVTSGQTFFMGPTKTVTVHWKPLVTISASHVKAVVTVSAGHVKAVVTVSAGHMKPPLNISLCLIFSVTSPKHLEKGTI